MRQGDVRWCDFPRPAGRRPVVILTRDDHIRHLNAVVVAPVTGTLRDIPAHVRLGPSDGLERLSEAALDQLQTVRKERVGTWISTLTDQRMREINAAIAYALGFDRYEED